MPRARRKKTKDDKNIEQTLDDLGIDQDLPPDAAALEMAAQDQQKLAAEKGGEPEIPDPDPSPPPPKLKAVPDPATSTVVETEKPQPAPEPPPVEAKIPDPDPLPHAAPPPPPPPRAKKPPKSPATGKLGTGLSSKIPGAEHIKVYKRVDGQLGHVKDFRLADLQGFPDMESFLNRYVKPSYGAGEYELKGIDAYGREVPAGSVLLLDPEGPSAEQGPYAVMQAMMEQQARQNQQWMEQMKVSMQPAVQPPPVDPVSMLRNVMSLQDEVGKKGEAAQAEARAAQAAAASETQNAMTGMMQMFMASQQAAAQQNQQMMTAMMAMMNKPKEQDPIMAALLTRLMEEKKGGDSMAGMVPPPPPPPDPMEGLAKMITALAPLLGGGGGGGDDEVKEMLKLQVQAREAERMGPKEIIALMGEMKHERGTDDFKKAADNLGMMLNITNQLRNNTEGGAAAGFFDALAALFSNRDFAGSIAQTVRSRAEEQQKVQLQEQQKALLLQQRALLTAKQQQQKLAAKAQAAMPTGAPPQANGVSNGSPVPPVSQPAPPPPQAPPPSNGEAPVVVEEFNAQSEAPMPRLPANTVDHINAMLNASDEAGLIEGVIRMLVYFAEFEEWRGFAETLLGAAQEGLLRETLQYLAALFEKFISIQLMDEELAKKALTAVKNNFDLIHQGVQGDGVIEEEEEGDDFDFLADEEGEDDEGIEDGPEEDSPSA